MDPSISIVIPVFNQIHWTRRCLSSLLENTQIAREIYLIDNDSTDETPSYLQKVKPSFEAQGWDFNILTNSENRGFGRACNQGIRMSRSDFAVVLNNDTWLMQGGIAPSQTQWIEPRLQWLALIIMRKNSDQEK
jgi:GT2 family glycosyltransferase